MIRPILKRYLFIEGINPSNANEYFTGKFDGIDHVFPKWMDFGKDHYVKNTFNNTLNEKEYFL